MILILSDGVSNKSVDDVIDWINYYEGKYICLRSDEILDPKIAISIASDNDFVFNIENKYHIISLDEINVIWNWRWYDYKLNKYIQDNSNQIRRYLNEELSTLYHYFREYTSHKIWWGERYVNKITALKEAQKAGMNIPSSLITKSKDDLRSFKEKHGQIIIKPISNGIFFNKNKKKHGMYTVKVTANFIDNMPKHFFPVLAQQEIQKSYEIRSFFMDGKFYSAAIISQNDRTTAVDFRNYNLINPNRVIPYKLPEEIEAKLNIVMRNLNLDTGSIDIINAKGEYYFLEINPMGQFDMVSSPCNYMLSKHIAFFLITKDIEYEKKKNQR